MIIGKVCDWTRWKNSVSKFLSLVDGVPVRDLVSMLVFIDSDGWVCILLFELRKRFFLRDVLLFKKFYSVDLT